jgi:hypothetical protein
VEQLDDFAGWVKAKRVALAPVQAVLSRGKLNDGRLPDGEMAANLEERDPQAVRSARVTIPSGASADRDSWVAGTRPRHNPQLGRIPAKMRAELTSAEMR